MNGSKHMFFLKDQRNYEQKSSLEVVDFKNETLKRKKMLLLVTTIVSLHKNGDNRMIWSLT